MRLRTYVDGKPAWSENVPSIGRMTKWALGGPIEPHPNPTDLAHAKDRAYKERRKANKAWYEAHKAEVMVAQRAYRQRWWAASA